MSRQFTEVVCLVSLTEIVLFYVHLLSLFIFCLILCMTFCDAYHNYYGK